MNFSSEISLNFIDMTKFMYVHLIECLEFCSVVLVSSVDNIMNWCGVIAYLVSSLMYSSSGLRHCST